MIPTDPPVSIYEHLRSFPPPSANVPVSRPVCENCQHWRQKDHDNGDCVKKPLGLGYERSDGSRHVAWYWTTGKYVTCAMHERRDHAD